MVIITVYPSGSACATYSAPIKPFAPARLSTITACFKMIANWFAKDLATASVPPAAGNGTTSFIGFVGQFRANTLTANSSAK
jgi:hypothetical protein